MPKKKHHHRFDHVEKHFAALHGRYIARETIRPTALEAAEANARFNPPISGMKAASHIIEIHIGYNVHPNYEMPLK